MMSEHAILHAMSILKILIDINLVDVFRINSAKCDDYYHSYGGSIEVDPARGLITHGEKLVCST